MGDSLDDMIAWSREKRERARVRKQANLATADTSAWRRLSEHHFRRRLRDGGYVDWWPLTRKFVIIGIGRNQYRGKYRSGEPNSFIAKHSTLAWSVQA